MKQKFISLFFIFILVADKAALINSNFKVPRRSLKEKDSGASDLAYLEDVFGQLLLYIGIYLGIPLEEAELQAGLKNISFRDKKEKIMEYLGLFVNVVDGVTFNDDACKFDFDTSPSLIVQASETCVNPEVTVKDLGAQLPVDYLLEKVRDPEQKNNKFVFLVGKGEGSDMEILMAIEVQPFKKVVRKKQEIKSENELELEHEQAIIKDKSHSEEDLDDLLLERKLTTDKKESEEIPADFDENKTYENALPLPLFENIKKNKESVEDDEDEVDASFDENKTYENALPLPLFESIKKKGDSVEDDEELTTSIDKNKKIKEESGEDDEDEVDASFDENKTYENALPLPLFENIKKKEDSVEDDGEEVVGSFDENKTYENALPLPLFENIKKKEDSIEDDGEEGNGSGEEEIVSDIEDKQYKNALPLPLFDNIKDKPAEEIVNPAVTEEINIVQTDQVEVKNSAKINTDEPVIADKSKIEDTGEVEMVIRLINNVAESRLKVQYSEVILPSTNTFLNNVVTSFMLKNEQLIYDINPVKTDIVKSLIHIFGTEEIGADFNPNVYKLDSGKKIEEAIAADSMSDPSEINRLGFNSIKYHIHFIDLGSEAGDKGTYYQHYKDEGERIVDSYGDTYKKEESTMFVLKPRLMNTSPVFIILSKNDIDIRIIFSSDYFESTDFFTFATRPLITKVIERKMKRINDRIFRPFMLLDEEHQDEDYNLEASNLDIGKIFKSTLIKSLNALKKSESSIGDIQLDQEAESEQNIILILDSLDDCNDELIAANKDAVMCVHPHPIDLSSHEYNMFEVHIKVLHPHPQMIIKRYPKNSLYDMGLFTKSFARYLSDMVSSITAVNDKMISETLYKNSFPFFVPTMKGIEYDYVNNDIFFIDESKAKVVTNRAKLALDLIKADADHPVRTVGFGYGDELEEQSNFAAFLKGGAVANVVKENSEEDE